MTTLSLCWDLLSNVGNLPNELISKILYEYGGLRHPVVNILLESTKNDEYEILQKLPISNSIYKFYLNKDYYGTLFNIDIISYLNNKQCNYYKNKQISYIHYNDPGYFFRRQFGRLYYEVVNDDCEVIKTKQLNWAKNILI